MSSPEKFLHMAIDLACTNVSQKGGRPFGAVLVQSEQVIATGVNQILKTHDPTSHAELEALRTASQLHPNLDLTNTVMYASGHPCPMCLAAMHMVGIQTVYYAYSNAEAEPFGLSSHAWYKALGLQKPERPQLLHHPMPAALTHPYLLWQAHQAVS